MSQKHWELLAKITTGQVSNLTLVCQGLARETDAERLFCVVAGARGEHVLAIDCDGYPLGYAAERLTDGGLSEFVLRLPNNPSTSSEPEVIRRVSRASKRTVVAGRLRVQPDLAVSLILENRFAGEALASFDDQDVVRWLVLLGLVVRLNAVGEHAEPSASGEVERAARLAVAAEAAASASNASAQPLQEARQAWDSVEQERQRADTLGALHEEQWNISRAARRLGMTRHGLKKRMRRLSLLKAS